MEEDGEGVNKLFEKAPQVGIQVQVNFIRPYFISCYWFPSMAIWGIFSLL